MLTYITEPADPILGALLQVLAPGDVVAAIRSGATPAAAAHLDEAQVSRVRLVLSRWRVRLAIIPADAGLAACAARGIRLVCPGDPGWPAQLDDLGAARPYALWVRGTTDLQSCCQQSVAVVGARAATAYGTHVCTEITTALSVGGWTILSGGAYGIDACAHRAALAAGGSTVAVLACGPDVAYPREHSGLLDAVAVSGAVVSEWPPGALPTQQRFLLRNRLVAAMASGTVVVEAGRRSGTLSTARHAMALGRPLMAVRGPVTSTMSAGCHTLIRDQRAILVTSPADVLACLPSALP
jgi:DNA processing protein